MSRGRRLACRHLGNDTNLAQRDRRPAVRPLASLTGQFDLRGWLAPHSDVVALMVLEHQATMSNLITRTGWEARVAGQAAAPREPPPPAAGAKPSPDRVRDAAVELVDYMLFVDEAPFAGTIDGSSNFARTFSEWGPRDRQGRSLRQLDLRNRLMRYPCSYLIYSDAFDAMPPLAKAAVYERMWHVLSGQEQAAPYDRLTRDDRKAVAEILVETKDGLPEFFKGSITR